MTKKEYHDEWYTKSADMVLLDKKANLGTIIKPTQMIYCPCDGSESEIYKYLKNNFPNNVVVHTTYDFHKLNVNKDDIIITNPPFSILNDFIKHFQKNEMIIIMPANRTTYSTTRGLIMNRLFKTYITHRGQMSFTSGVNPSEKDKSLYCDWYHLTGGVDEK